jgi:hypothetical protein
MIGRAVVVAPPKSPLPDEAVLAGIALEHVSFNLKRKLMRPNKALA